MRYECSIYTVKQAMDTSFAEYVDITRDWDQKWEALKAAHVSGNHFARDATGAAVRQMCSMADIKKITFTISCAAFIEVMVNQLIAMKLDESNSVDQFEKFDQESIWKKWRTHVPRLVPGFTIEGVGRIEQSLKELLSDRNAIVHMRPRIVDSETNAIAYDGNLPKYLQGKPASIIETMTFWKNLPRELVDQVIIANESTGKMFEMFCWYHHAGD